MFRSSLIPYHTGPRCATSGQNYWITTKENEEKILKKTSYAKTNGIPLNFIIRNFHIIIKGQEIIQVSHNWHLKKMTKITCLVNSTENTMIWLKPFKGWGPWMFFSI
jgi:hypothetical protein